MANQSSQNDAIDALSSLSPEEQKNQDILKAKSDRKQFYEGIVNGTLGCMPDQNGFADTSRVSNPVNDSYYKGVTLLLLKDFAKKNNFPTNEFVTFNNLSTVNNKLDVKFDKQLRLQKGSKGFTIVGFETKMDENNQPVLEAQRYRLFNVAQLENSELINEYNNIVKNQRMEYAKKEAEKEGRTFTPYSSNKSENNKKLIVCSSTKPNEYLGQYFAAVSSGANFKVTKEQAQEFKKNVENFLFEKNQENHINPFKLNVLSKQANEYCKEYLSTQHQKKDVSQTKLPPNQNYSRSASDSYEMEL